MKEKVSSPVWPKAQYKVVKGDWKENLGSNLSLPYCFILERKPLVSVGQKNNSIVVGNWLDNLLHVGKMKC